MKVKCTKFGVDKIYHAIAGAACSLVSLIVILVVCWLDPFPLPFTDGLIIIEAVVLIIAVLKEIFDGLFKKTYFDPIDVLFTILGGQPVVLVWWLVCKSIA